MAINLEVALWQLLGIVVVSIIASPILWLVGRAIVGREKAKFSDAFWIIFLGQVIGGLFNLAYFAVFEVSFAATIIALIIQLVIWVGLVKHFFDTGWGRALGISILSVIVAVVISVILVLILMGVGMLIGWQWWPT